MLLVDANRVVPAERIIDDVWAGAPSVGAVATLHSHVSQLRRVVGRDRLQRVGAGYRLEVGAGELDAARFEEALDCARVAHGEGGNESVEVLLDGVLRSWRGAPFADVDGEGWVTAPPGGEHHHVAACCSCATSTRSGSRSPAPAPWHSSPRPR